jgi:hypothetical protein
MKIDPNMKCKCSHCGIGEVMLRGHGDVYKVSCDNPECKLVYAASGWCTQVQLIEGFQHPDEFTLYWMREWAKIEGK